MALSVESDHYIQQLCLLSAARITYIIGLMIHFFIVGVSVIDWLRRRPLTPVDLLITAIGTSRISFQIITLFGVFWETFSQTFSTAPFFTLGVIGDSSVYCDVWLSVLLSVFYTLKISNFHNILFLYLKKIISQRLLGLTITFVMLSIGYSSAEVLAIVVNTPKNSTHEDKFNSFEVRIFFILLWNLLPFLIYFISSFALLGSLFHHIYRLERDKNITSPLGAYFKTIKFIVVSFICFASYVGINVFETFFFFFSLVPFCLILNCITMLHSIYLIYVTGRLRRHFLKILHSMTKCLLLSRDSESRSGIQLQIISQ